ncbi:MAG TPA: methyltransferase domain-containing protein [Bryobacteraceae bacterium]|nr:methyltransferase domain-containing protein [Bryobacteraceae bacterium]
MNQAEGFENNSGLLEPRAEEFAGVLRSAKEAVEKCNFEWYRYDSLGNLGHLDRLLSARPGLVELAGEKPVLDFGCADGDLAFFLESLGLHVVTFDHVRTNHNGMLGVRALKQQLGSRVEIHELDLDNNFEIPDGHYGLALVLGILYHLKNPFYVLETISKRARYCLLSTRITRFLPDRRTDVSKVPMAYLLGEDELNADVTNFWIFSEAGLRRIVERANWRVIEFLRIGDTEASDPDSLDHDERAFLLLESVYGLGHLDLKEGWHAPEPAGWRWTEKQFRILLSNATVVILKVYVPPSLLERFGSVTLSAEANGQPLAPETYTVPGNATYSRRLPEGPVDLTFRLSHAFPPSEADQRELGIVVVRLDAE